VSSTHRKGKGRVEIRVLVGSTLLAGEVRADSEGSYTNRFLPAIMGALTLVSTSLETALMKREGIVFTSSR
jgi:hypothetical protein